MTSTATTSRGVAFITGAAQGIGADVALRLADLGFAIAAVDRHLPSEATDAITASGHRARAYECDITDWDRLSAVVDSVEAELGPIETCVAAAGILESTPFIELEPESWQRIVDINLLGTFQTCRLTAARMVQRERGAIVCIASNSADLAYSGTAAYSAAKAGIVGLARVMALELGPHGITANVICPGLIRTPATEPLFDIPGFEARELEAIPMRRAGTPRDIAEAVAFFADLEASPWITGQTLTVDGGFSTHGQLQSAGSGEIPL